jgi:hypothetical protein
MAQVSASSDDRCCPWGAVRDRCYGHVEGTIGEDEPGSGVQRWSPPEPQDRPDLSDHMHRCHAPEGAAVGGPGGESCRSANGFTAAICRRMARDHLGRSLVDLAEVYACGLPAAPRGPEGIGGEQLAVEFAYPP